MSENNEKTYIVQVEEVTLTSRNWAALVSARNAVEYELQQTAKNGAFVKFYNQIREISTEEKKLNELTKT